VPAGLPNAGLSTFRADAMKQTPKKHKPLRHGATSFTGNRRRKRDDSRKPQPDAARTTADVASPNATNEEKAEDARDDQRLQKILAAAGVGSRRECEELILAGRVEVDGQPVTELGVRVDSRKQKITLDGEQVKFQRRTYFAVNKPTGVLSTNRDPSGRIRVVDLIGGAQRLFTVGRLDQHSDGLIIVTNDGELTQRLTHPKYGVPKTYLVQVAGAATNEVIAKLLAGVRLEEGIAKAARASIRKRHANHTVLEMVLTEGRNREIRRMLAQLGHKVQRLTRVAVGPIRLGKLAPGQFRPLESQEVKALKELAFHPEGATRTSAPRGKRPQRDKFDARRERFSKDRPPAGDESSPPSRDARPGRPNKFGKPTFEKTPYEKKPFGKKSLGNKPSGQKPFVKKPLGARSAEQEASQEKSRDEKKFANQRFGERKPGKRKLGAQKFDSKPPREKKFGERKFADRRGKRPPLATGDARDAKFSKATGKSHPLPFLKQGLVLDEEAPASASQPSTPKPRRRKPLRRLNVRRK
jgi:23S rRNA pseudouridine2605 synthase